MNPARLLTNMPTRIALVAGGVCRNVTQTPSPAPAFLRTWMSPAIMPVLAAAGGAPWSGARSPAASPLIGDPPSPLPSRPPRYSGRIRRGEQHRQLYQAAQQVAVLPAQLLRLDREPQIGEAGDQPGQPDLDLLLGQVRPDAVMRAVPEGQ